MPNESEHHEAKTSTTKYEHHGHCHRLEGKKTREYHAYQNMKKRCVHPENPKYPSYGGRGITICQRWLGSFQAFIDDMGRCPPGMTLDRKNNNGNYEPGNCRWATPQQQGNNQRTNHRLDYNGENLTIAEWSRKLGISRDLIRQRVKLGWPLERVFTEPAQDHSLRKLRVEYGGKSLSLVELTRKFGLSKNTLKERINHGWPIDKVVSELRHVRAKNGLVAGAVQGMK